MEPIPCRREYLQPDSRGVVMDVTNTLPLPVDLLNAQMHPHIQYYVHAHVNYIGLYVILYCV